MIQNKRIGCFHGKIINRYIQCSIALLISCAFFSCTLPFFNHDDDSSQTIDYESQDDGWVLFRTNANEYLNCSFIYLIPNSDSSTTYEVSLVKKSGYAYGDFGIVYRASDTDNCYMVNIDTMGNYSVKRKSGGIIYEITPWTASDNLRSGYDTQNTITVTSLTETPSRFTIAINGVIEQTMYDANYDSASPGVNGFFVFVAGESNEAFPGIPVDVRFKN